jgi:guanylate kinase
MIAQKWLFGQGPLPQSASLLYHAPMSSSGILILLIGPSGVGKSVILKALKKSHPEYVFPRSATTRARREREGDDLYHFMTDDKFSSWLKEGQFLEWAQVHKGARYGTLLKEIIPAIEAGKTVIREVDVQGFQSIRAHRFFTSGGPYRLRTIFILPESEDQLVKHITKRAPISSDELARRVESIRTELAVAPMTDVQIRNIEGKLQETIAGVERAIAS